ncbi:MAG: SpoIVB peptidase S55 domain-containing protein [Armatimonadota bacterium]
MSARLKMLVLVAVLAFPAAGVAQSAPPIMPLSEVRPGMRGIGKTVVSGQKVEEFQFEVMDILQWGFGPITAEKLIMFRMLGPLTERTGGSAAGMSGSPLYINGKLIGALSASFNWQAPRRDVVLATPIEDMLKVLERRSSGTAEGPTVYHASRPVDIGGRRYDRIALVASPLAARRLAAQHPEGGLAIATPAVAAFARGFSPRASKLLAAVVEPLGHEILQGHGGRRDFVAQPIVPGSTIGIETVRGDFDFGGICTVAVRVGNRILACGHPWENQGDVEYILTASEVVSVVRSIERPFKMSNLGAMVGVAEQDRGTAVAGTLGPLPRLFNLRVVVTDLDTGTRVQKGAQMVRRRDLARALAPLVALSATELARNQGPGEGTATVKLTLRAKGLAAPIVRENMFFSSRDVATASVLDVVDAMELAFYNDIRKLEPFDLTVETSLTKRRVTASIVDVQVASREVSPGGLLRVRVVLQPYLAERPLTRFIEVPVPADFPRGPAVVVVRSAGVDAPGVPVEDQLAGLLVAEPVPWGVASLDDALQLFANFGRNTDLAVRIQPFGLPTTATDFTRFDVPAGRSLRTEWVIQGGERIPIVVR